jgi:hypothetical protein
VDDDHARSNAHRRLHLVSISLSAFPSVRIRCRLFDRYSFDIVFEACLLLYFFITSTLGGWLFILMAVVRVFLSIFRLAILVTEMNTLAVTAGWEANSCCIASPRPVSLVCLLLNARTNHVVMTTGSQMHFAVQKRTSFPNIKNIHIPEEAGPFGRCVERDMSWLCRFFLDTLFLKSFQNIENNKKKKIKNNKKSYWPTSV